MRVDVCWGPECGVAIERAHTGAPKQYCSPRCRMRSFRRNGGKAPDTPYPPLVASGVPAPAGRGARPPVDKPKPVKARSKSPEKKPPRSASRPGGGAAAHAETTAAPVASLPAEPAAVEPTPEEVQALLDAHRAANEPEPPPEHAMVVSYKADLDKLGQLTTRQGLLVIELAEKLVSPATSPAAAAGISKELDRRMADLEQASPSAQALADPSLVIRERTLAKLRAVAS